MLETSKGLKCIWEMSVKLFCWKDFRAGSEINSWFQYCTEMDFLIRGGM